MCDLCDESSGRLREVVTRRGGEGGPRWNRTDEAKAEEEEKEGGGGGGGKTQA